MRILRIPDPHHWNKVYGSTLFIVIPVNQPTDKVNEINQQVTNATDKSINLLNDKVTAEDEPTAAIIDNDASKIADNNTETTASKTDNEASKDVLTTNNSNEKADNVEDRNEAVTEVQIMTTKIKELTSWHLPSKLLRQHLKK